MKNNRAALTGEDARLITKNLGDPDLFRGVLREAEDTGESSIIQLNLANPAAYEIYEDLKNNPDKYQVIQESDFGGRDKIMVVLRYVRKGPWKPDLSRLRSFEASDKGSKKPRALSRKKVAGFGAAVKKKKATEKK